MASFWQELKRRNVVKIALAYAGASWLILQLTDVLVPMLQIPDWAGRLVLLLLVAGFPVALFIAWAYQLTPEGLKRDASLAPDDEGAVQGSKRLNVILFVLLGLAVAYIVADRYFGFGDPAVETTSELEASVAVLPFVDMSPGQDQAYFSDGISEELLNELTRLRGLHVAGRTSSFSFRDSTEDLRSIGAKLDVAHIIEGSVRRAGDQVRITVQLIKVSDGYHLWSQTFDRQLDDIFAIQEETARAVADALSVTLGVGDVTFAPGGTRNFEAYDARLEAQSLLLQQGGENMIRAMDLLEHAVELDPNYADAWSLLATAYSNSATLWMSDRAQEMRGKANRAALRALEIAPEAAQSQRAAATLYAQQGELFEAEQAMLKALELAPNDLINNTLYGYFLTSLGRPRDAIKYLREAVRIDPLALTPALQLALAYQVSGNIEAAMREYDRAKGLIGNHALLDGTRVVIALERRDIDQARRIINSIAENPEMSPVGRSFSVLILDVLDSPESGRAALRQAYEQPEYSDPLSHGVISNYAAFFGDDELVLQIMKELQEQGVLTFDSVWRPIFKEARKMEGFKNIVRDQGLVDYWTRTGNWGQFCRPVGDDDFMCE